MLPEPISAGALATKAALGFSTLLGKHAATQLLLTDPVKAAIRSVDHAFTGRIENVAVVLERWLSNPDVQNALEELKRAPTWEGVPEQLVNPFLSGDFFAGLETREAAGEILNAFLTAVNERLLLDPRFGPLLADARNEKRFRELQASVAHLDRRLDDSAAGRVTSLRTAADPLFALQIPGAFPPHEEVFHPHTLRDAFTGRARQRKILTNWWTADGPPVRVLVGMGGQGKSSLAWVWMREDVLGGRIVDPTTERKRRPRGTGIPAARRPEGVFWWSFYAPELQIDRNFELFVDRALGYVTHGKVKPSDIPSLDEKINALLRRLRHGRFLLILDGFERATRLYERLSAPYDAELQESEPATDLRWCSDERAGRFLRDAAAGSSSRVLITSRVYPADVDGVANVERHDLKGLDPKESLELFRTLKVRGSDEDILSACEAVDYHPLAIYLMIRHALKVPGRYRGHVQALPDLSSKLTLEDRHRHIFEVAYHSLNVRDREFFGRVAVFTQATSYDVLRNCSPDRKGKELDEAIKELEERGFLSFDQRHLTYDMHPLVRQYAYAQMATDERRAAAREAYNYLAERLPTQETSLAILSQTLEVYRQAMQGGLVGIAIEIFRYRLYPILFFRIGECHTQVRLLEELIAAARETSEPVDLYTLSALMHHMSTACNLAGFPRDGFRWAMEAEEMLAPHDPSEDFAAYRLVYIASGAMRIGMLRHATHSLERCVVAAQQGRNRFREGIARLNLAWALTWSGRFDEVGPHLEAAADIFGGTPKHRHWQCILLVHRTRLALLTGQGKRAWQHARDAYEIAVEDRNETDLVRSRWALGASLVRRVEEDPALREACLPEAETHLLSALKTCSAIQFGEFAMELHIAMAHWHYANRDPEQAGVAAESARALARKGGHAVKEAEAEEILLELANAAEMRGHIPQGARAAIQSSATGDQAAMWALTALPCVRPLPLDHAE